jgi:hypothetical protein
MRVMRVTGVTEVLQTCHKIPPYACYRCHGGVTCMPPWCYRDGTRYHRDVDRPTQEQISVLSVSASDVKGKYGKQCKWCQKDDEGEWGETFPQAHHPNNVTGYYTVNNDSLTTVSVDLPSEQCDRMLHSSRSTVTTCKED